MRLWFEGENSNIKLCIWVLQAQDYGCLLSRLVTALIQLPLKDNRTKHIKHII